jgi:hypothetical protein
VRYKFLLLLLLLLLLFNSVVVLVIDVVFNKVNNNHYKKNVAFNSSNVDILGKVTSSLQVSRMKEFLLDYSALS